MQHHGLGARQLRQPGDAMQLSAALPWHGEQTYAMVDACAGGSTSAMARASVLLSRSTSLTAAPVDTTTAWPRSPAKSRPARSAWTHHMHAQTLNKEAFLIGLDSQGILQQGVTPCKALRCQAV